MSQRVALFFLMFLSCFHCLNAQQIGHLLRGKVMEREAFNSKILDKEVRYTIYLPPGYDHSNRKYPVVYLLHGYTDSDIAWVQFGEIQAIADEGINNRDIPPMIIVTPDAGVTWYINDHEGKVRYEDMFIQEFIPYIDQNYRTRIKKEFRGISGLSMGGYGAFLYAIKHPELFAASTPLSAAFYTEEEVISHEQERWDRIEAVMYGKHLKGKGRLTKHWKANNPFHLLANTPVDDIKSVRYYFDCGDDDFLYKGNSKMHTVLRDMEIPHEFRIRDGGHSWSYWRTGILDALIFISKSFKR
ncbi:alpha/beta hydrolase family protein [Fulvivirgaceae bacterium BMA12]|uniref:Alpha/beta hydrolase family protein n=1 Tax=Agaribacillus aureus TaxID=3051825 RepID=A0ABT8LC13_9BACT|nr:alpha/beta hydrolase family protein [Fulvivirgaceae bacterium BMA12]